MVFVVADEAKIVADALHAVRTDLGVRLELPNPDYALPAGIDCKLRFDEPAAAS